MSNFIESEILEIERLTRFQEFCPELLVGKPWNNENFVVPSARWTRPLPSSGTASYPW